MMLEIQIIFVQILNKMASFGNFDILRLPLLTLGCAWVRMGKLVVKFARQKIWINLAKVVI